MRGFVASTTCAASRSSRTTRELQISRNTVRKILRSGATEFEYERSVQPQPRLGPWLEELDRLLAENAARGSRERLTRIRVFEELRGLGYQGGYDAVRRYASGWRRQQSEATAAAFVPPSFAPGEAYQFDWSHEVVLMRGMPITVKVAHVRLCHSRMPFVPRRCVCGTSRLPTASATTASRRGNLMERIEILAAMGGLKLFGMRSGYDEIMATAVKRKHEPRDRSSATC